MAKLLELKGTRRYDIANTYVDVIMVGASTATDALPTYIGSTYVELFGGTEFFTTGIVGGTMEAVQISGVKRATPNYTHATIRFRGYWTP